VASVPRDAECQRATARGVGWALTGGEAAGAEAANSLVIDEIHNVNEVLEQVALGKIKVDFIEALACSGGCIGGPLTVENRFVAKHRMQQRLAKMRAEDEAGGVKVFEFFPDSTLTEYDRHLIKPRPIMRLDEDIFKAMYKVELMEKTLKELPGLDCGSCGSPNCQALAEDIVQGEAVETDCIFKLRERVRDLAQEMVGLAAKLPPPLEEREDEE